MFSADRRDVLLRLLAAGEPLGRACSAVGVSRWTVARWAAAGRAAGATGEQRDFAARLDGVRGRAGEVASSVNGHELSGDEADRLLASAARRGSVSALTELRRRQSVEPEGEQPLYPADHPFAWTDESDPFVALEPLAMTELTPEQQERAREVSEAAQARAVASIECSRRAAE